MVLYLLKYSGKLSEKPLNLIMRRGQTSKINRDKVRKTFGSKTFPHGLGSVTTILFSIIGLMYKAIFVLAFLEMLRLVVIRLWTFNGKRFLHG